jgi:hypothetical protein
MRDANSTDPLTVIHPNEKLKRRNVIGLAQKGTGFHYVLFR